jgi:predicted dehydrogenase
LGTGFWGSEWIRALSSLDGFIIAGTAGANAPKVPEQARTPDYRHYDDYRAAIDTTGADAVLVALPVALHADAVQRAIAAERHVLCEKPATKDAAEMASLLAAAATRPELVVMVNQNYRWRPWAQLVKSTVAEGTLGKIAHIGLRFSQPEFLAGGRSELAMPLLQDMAIHHFDLLRYVSGKNAVEVYAREHRPFWSEFSGSPGLDAVITMEDDVRVSYSGSWASRGGVTPWDGDFAIQGDRGLLAVSNGRVFLHPDSDRDNPSGTQNNVGPEPIPLELPSVQLGDLQSSANNFRQAINLGVAADTSVWDNCHSLAMVFAAEESIQARRPVQVESWTR